MDNLIGIEVLGWYDGISHRKDENGNLYSRNKYTPMDKDELCRYGKIYKVSAVGDYEYAILSERDE